MACLIWDSLQATAMWNNPVVILVVMDQPMPLTTSDNHQWHRVHYILNDQYHCSKCHLLIINDFMLWCTKCTRTLSCRNPVSKCSNIFKIDNSIQNPIQR